MKVGGKEIKIETGEIVELKEGEFIQILVPFSDNRTAVHLTVINGKLEIAGGSSIIDRILGPGMAEKVQE